MAASAEVTQPPVPVVFAGSDEIGLPALRALAAGLGGTVRLVGVLTQPDRPHGRGLKLEANPVKRAALELGVPVRQPERIAAEDLNWLRGIGTGLVVVMAYGQILRPDFLALPRHGVLNLHASLLPAYRGASPLQAAIASGDAESGVALMRIVPELDAGPVHAEERVALEHDETAASLWLKIANAAARLLERALPEVLAGRLPAVPQDASRVTYCRRLEREDADLDFRVPAAVLERRARAFTPWPGAAVNFGDGQRWKLGRLEARGAGAEAPPGTILTAGPGGIEVATVDGRLVIRELQRPGGRMLPAAEFLRGCPVAVGTVWPSAELRPIVSREKFPRAPKTNPTPRGGAA